MTDHNSDRAEAPIFSAVLTPYRSLSRRGFVIVMVCVALVNAVAGVVFYRIGAWPVIGFCGLDVALICGAFLLNYRAARAFQEIAVTPYEICVRKVSHQGRTQEYRFNPAWVRLHVTTIEDEGVTAIRLVSHGKGLAVAEFLNPDDRTTFAKALKGALGAARAGVTLHG